MVFDFIATCWCFSLLMRTEMFCWTGFIICIKKWENICFEKYVLKCGRGQRLESQSWSVTTASLRLSENRCWWRRTSQSERRWCWYLNYSYIHWWQMLFFWFIVPVETRERKDSRCFHVFVILDSRLWRLFPPQLHQRTSSWILIFLAGAQTGFSTVCVLVFFPRTLRHKAFVGGLPACCSGAYMRGWRGGERGCCGDCRA